MTGPRLASQESKQLTPREYEIAALLVRGLTNQEIAREIGTSWQTIKNQLSSMYTKLNVDGRVKAIQKLTNRESALLLKALPSNLTERQAEIFRMVELGAYNKEIAHALGISRQTVKNHLNVIYAKMNVRSRADAVTQVLDGKEIMGEYYERSEWYEPLTPAEILVVKLLLSGYTTDEALSKQLNVVPKTVMTHLSTIYSKLFLSNRVDLCLYALRSGWFDCYGNEINNTASVVEELEL